LRVHPPLRIPLESCGYAKVSRGGDFGRLGVNMRVLIALIVWAVVSGPAAIVTGRALRGPRHAADRSSVARTPGLAMASALGAATLLILASVLLAGGSLPNKDVRSALPKTAKPVAPERALLTAAPAETAEPIQLVPLPAMAETPVAPPLLTPPLAASVAPAPTELIIDLAAWFPETVSTSDSTTSASSGSTREHGHWRGTRRGADPHGEGSATSR